MEVKQIVLTGHVCACCRRIYWTLMKPKIPFCSTACETAQGRRRIKDRPEIDETRTVEVRIKAVRGK